MDEGKGDVFTSRPRRRKPRSRPRAAATPSATPGGKDRSRCSRRQLQSGVAPQFDQRTNTIFYRENRSNLDKINLFLESDRPPDPAGHDRGAPRRSDRQPAPELRHQLGRRRRRLGHLRRPFSYGGSDHRHAARVANAQTRHQHRRSTASPSQTITPLVRRRPACPSPRHATSATLPHCRNHRDGGTSSAHRHFLCATPTVSRRLGSAIAGQFAILSVPADVAHLRLAERRRRRGIPRPSAGRHLEQSEGDDQDHPPAAGAAAQLQRADRAGRVQRIPGQGIRQHARRSRPRSTRTTTSP